jgi:hypothetical protein
MRDQKMAWIHETDIPDEYRWIRIRLYRDDLLSGSDWRMVEDATWNKSAWTVYRQALRDLPSTNTDPMKIVFPNEPSE